MSYSVRILALRNLRSQWTQHLLILLAISTFAVVLIALNATADDRVAAGLRESLGAGRLDFAIGIQPLDTESELSSVEARLAQIPDIQYLGPLMVHRIQGQLQTQHGQSAENIMLVGVEAPGFLWKELGVEDTSAILPGTIVITRDTSKNLAISSGEQVLLASARNKSVRTIFRVSAIVDANRKALYEIFGLSEQDHILFLELHEATRLIGQYVYRVRQFGEGWVPIPDFIGEVFRGEGFKFLAGLRGGRQSLPGMPAAAKQALAKVRDEIVEAFPEKRIVVADSLSNIVREYGAQVSEAGYWILLVTLPLLGLTAYTVYLSIANSYSQRRRALALLLARGTDRSQLRRILMIESSILGLLGGAIGVGLSFLGTMWLRLRVQEGTEIHTYPGTWQVILTLAAGIFLTVMSARACLAREPISTDEIGGWRQKAPTGKPRRRYDILAVAISSASIAANFFRAYPISSALVESLWSSLSLVLAPLGILAPLLLAVSSTRLVMSTLPRATAAFSGSMRVVFGKTVLIARRNLVRDHIENSSLAGVAAMIIASAAFATVFPNSLMATSTRLNDIEVGSDLRVASSSLFSADHPLQMISDFLERELGARVTEISGLRMYHYETHIYYVISPREYLAATSRFAFHRRWIQDLDKSKEGILLDRRAAERLNVGKGDAFSVYLRFSAPEGTILVRVNFTVVGIFDRLPGIGASSDLTPKGVITSDLFGEIERQLKEQGYTQEAKRVEWLLVYSPDLGAGALAEELENRFPSIAGAIGVRGQVIETTSFATSVGLTKLTGVLFVFILAGSALSFIALFAVKQRHRRSEINLLIARGAGRTGVIGILLTESVSVLIPSMLVGLALSVPASYLACAQSLYLGTGEFPVFSAGSLWLFIGISLGVWLMLALAVSFVFYNSASPENLKEAIR